MYRLTFIMVLAGACGRQDAKPAGSAGSGSSASITTEVRCKDASECETSCDRNEAASCRRLALMLQKGEKGAATDPVRAYSLLQKSCSAGDMQGCNNLAVAYAVGAGVSKDRAKAAELYQRACDGGNSLSCTNLASMYMAGESVSKDVSRAISLYERACSVSDDCGELGVAHEFGNGVSNDMEKAKQLYERACNAGHIDGCLHLAIALLATDSARAAKLLQAPCDGTPDQVPIAQACTQLASLLINGDGVAKDVVRGAALAASACEQGHADGCYLQGATLLSGIGVDKDRDGGRALIAKACTMGSTIACDQSAKLGDAASTGANVRCTANSAKGIGCEERFLRAGAPAPSVVDLDDGRQRVTVKIEGAGGVTSDLEYVRDRAGNVYEALCVQEIDLAGRTSETRVSALKAIATFLQLIGDDDAGKNAFTWLTTAALQGAAANGTNMTKEFGAAKVIVSASAGAEGAVTTIRAIGKS